MVTVDENLLARTTSSLPSLLRSATATAWGPSPGASLRIGWIDIGQSCPRRKTLTALCRTPLTKSQQATTTSVQSGQVRLPTAKDQGPSGVVSLQVSLFGRAPTVSCK